MRIDRISARALETLRGDGEGSQLDPDRVAAIIRQSESSASPVLGADGRLIEPLLDDRGNEVDSDTDVEPW